MNNFSVISVTRLVVRVAKGERSRRQALGDALVVLVALPLLVTCSVLLLSCMSTDWVRDAHARFRVLALGVTLLVVSLTVCVYSIQRLGICSWPSAEQRAMPEHKIRRRTISGCLSPSPTLQDSELHLITGGGHFPPSYSSIIHSSDLPPAYCHMALRNEKADSTRSYLSPLHAAARPPGTG